MLRRRLQTSVVICDLLNIPGVNTWPSNSIQPLKWLARSASGQGVFWLATRVGKWKWLARPIGITHCQEPVRSWAPSIYSLFTVSCTRILQLSGKPAKSFEIALEINPKNKKCDCESAKEMVMRRKLVRFVEIVHNRMSYSWLFLFYPWKLILLGLSFNLGTRMIEDHITNVERSWLPVCFPVRVKSCWIEFKVVCILL